MKISESIILGLIQGLTEFLPVSSSGHLVLFQNLFGIEEATQAFSILLHMATLIAVFVYYWRDIWALIRRPFQRFQDRIGQAQFPRERHHMTALIQGTPSFCRTRLLGGCRNILGGSGKPLPFCNNAIITQ